MPTDPLRQALDHHRQGRLDDAAEAYRAMLQASTDDAEALHYLGVCRHQQGLHDEALQLLHRCLRVAPDDAGARNDLGNVLYALQRFDESAMAFEASLGLSPGQHAVWTSLGAAQREAGLPDDALASFGQAIALQPEYVPALQHLAQLHDAAGDAVLASHYHCRAFVLPPLEGKSFEMRGTAFYFLQRFDEAAKVYRDWLAAEPGHAVAEHMLAACSRATEAPARASDGYLERHFDRFADHFDANLLGSLGYRGPALIGIGLAIACPDLVERAFDAVDLGCGTGLCGPVIAPYSRSIIGVDLATKMLEKAAERGLYDRLEKAEIGEFLARRPAAFDLAVAADTLIYIGALDSLFAHLAVALRERGLFLFTIECTTDEDVAPHGVCLHASGRYRHSADHVRQCLLAQGMELTHWQPEPLREELGRPVAGALCVARKRGSLS
ncbi:tetratricopeptide repeat protein [Xylophilus sp. GOD-11R]|uniref:tetratricopeptide repeat protein n=1 Tax=Xylophilus sp. GOD-11R TaxID=3089814 RepID=UPI00298CC701|nr:tetratricopeptide repeat protein [Xylophilus sp. GOD-11R]WPB58822.1 tetratricopeptide repeat protein [Xylophilus sp. GOD-11R]